MCFDWQIFATAASPLHSAYRKEAPAVPRVQHVKQTVRLIMVLVTMLSQVPWDVGHHLVDCAHGSECRLAARRLQCAFKADCFGQACRMILLLSIRLIYMHMRRPLHLRCGMQCTLE